MLRAQLNSRRSNHCLLWAVVASTHAGAAAIATASTTALYTTRGRFSLNSGSTFWP